MELFVSFYNIFGGIIKKKLLLSKKHQDIVLRIVFTGSSDRFINQQIFSPLSKLHI